MPTNCVNWPPAAPTSADSCSLLSERREGRREGGREGGREEVKEGGSEWREGSEGGRE